MIPFIFYPVKLNELNELLTGMTFDELEINEDYEFSYVNDKLTIRFLTEINYLDFETYTLHFEGTYYE